MSDTTPTACYDHFAESVLYRKAAATVRYRFRRQVIQSRLEVALGHAALRILTDAERRELTLHKNCINHKEDQA